MKRGAINRVRVGDFVLVGLRDFQDEKADVIHKYDNEEVLLLKAFGEIDASVKLASDDHDNPSGFLDHDSDDDIEFNFSDGDIDEI